MTSNFNSRIQKLEAKLSPARNDMEPLIVWKNENLNDALKEYNKCESQDYKVEEVQSWHKQITADLVIYFPPEWRFKDYLQKPSTRKPSFDVTKLSNEELFQLSERYKPIFKQIEAAIEKEIERNTNNIFI